VTAKEKKLKGMAERFCQFHKEFSEFFQTKTRDNGEIAGQYLSGLVQTPKKNMERMEEKVPESNEQALQHFVTNSPWDERALLNKVADDASKLLGGNDSCLLIDETSFPKKGKKSVGVARQYCGRTGKIDNCQVAVFAALASKDKSVPVDFRLYLPKEWTEDKPRCLKAGIPESEIQLKTKVALAIEIVKEAKERGVKFNWVGADGGYGKDPAFLKALCDLDLLFVADVHKSQRIFFSDPTVTGENAQTVDQWFQKQSSWQTVTLRKSTKGDVIVEVLHANVWIKIGHEQTYRPMRLLVRRDAITKEDLKFSVSNAPDSINVERLVFMQGQRFWIERAFEDAKGTIGMGDYQLRKWRGWHHHMSLVMLAQLFLLRERLANAEDYPLLSCQDIVTMLAFYLPKRDVSEKEIFRQMDARHRKRGEDIDRAKS
jgi:SRSO17 transposase